MIRKHHILYNLFLLAVVTLLFSIGTASANPWWDSNWGYKTESVVSSTVFPYQMNLTIHSGTGISNETDVFLYNNVNTNFIDLRFLLNDTTELSYWIEDNTTEPIKAWINVTANGTVSTYYGNPTASDNSDGESTYILFDHFTGSSINTSKWEGNTGSVTVSNGILTVPQGYSINTITDFSGSVALRTNQTWKATGGDGTDSRFGFEQTSTDRITGEIDLNSYNKIQTYKSGSGTVVTTNFDTNTWQILDIMRDNVTPKAIFYKNNVEMTGSPITTNVPYINLPIKLVTAGTGGDCFIKLDWIFVRKYTTDEPVWGTWSTQLPNTPPTIPIINSPLNTSVHTSLTNHTMTLNVSSTDPESNAITYYFYGDMVDGNTFLGTNDTVAGNTYNWSISQYGIYYWKVYAADYMNNSDFTDLQKFTLIIPPNLTTPINSSTTYTTFPPLTSTVSFTWQDLVAPQYRLMVAEDENFNIMSVDTHVGTNNSNHDLLVNIEYFWKVYAYDGSYYSVASDVYQFNLTGNSTLTGSAIEGVVYQANGDVSAISGAEVTIWNTTWSSSMITGSNGYYVFEDLNSGTVYNLQAKSDRYWDSSIALVTAESDPVTNNFYLIDDLTDTEWWHYVEFTVQNVWGVTYPDVATNVYIGDSPTISESGNTESDGTISFHLNQNVQYHITFINFTLGINEDITLYPVATSYTVYIDSYSFDLPDTVTDDIQAYIVSSRINATYGYINFTWSDTSSLTSSINYYIHDVDGNELYNTSNSGPDMFNSQIVAATDDRYIVRYIGVHPTHGIIDKTETVVFHGGRRVDFGWPHDWQYAVTALAFLIFMGALFGAKTAHYGAITVVIFAWIFKWIGWLNETNTSTLLIILAAVIAFGWSLRKSEEVKM